MADAVRDVPITRVRGGLSADGRDRVAAEEPLEVRLHQRPFAVIMRTPGADRELAAGFLLAERVIASADDLGTIEHCALGDGPGAAAPNVVNVTLAGQAAARCDEVLAARRQIVTSASCGMCGRLTIDSLRSDLPALQSSVAVSAAILATLPDRLRAAQAAFDETGGLHAAGLFAVDGRLVEMAEDVGRHNAVDKVVGRMLMREALPLVDSLLFVSGRTSFEIVQKAFLAGIPIVAAVSAPSTLAIELAEEAGLTLVGFVRGAGFNVYANGARITAQ